MKQRSVVCLLTAVAMWTTLVTHVNPSKILLVPKNCNSHVMFFSRLGVGLAKLGHKITVLAPSNARVPDFVSSDDAHVNFTYVKYPVDGATPYFNSPENARRMMAIAMADSVVQSTRLVVEWRARVLRDSEQDCTRLLDNVELMRRIRDAKNQFAIMDPATGVSCYYTLPLALGVPYASLSTPIFPLEYFRIPRFESFPSAFSPTLQATFLERLKSFVVGRISAALMLYDDKTHFIKKYAPNHQPLLTTVEMMQRQSLWFLLENLSINPPLPEMPSTVAVGDIMAEAKVLPLTGEIKEFVSRSRRGVILVVFGSFCDLFPPSVLEPLCVALTQATKRFGMSVIWKLKQTAGFCRHDDILISPWVPQNDLLADSRVRLFISHAGWSSLIESVYHAKPVITFPIAFDQSANALFAADKGYAVRMNLANFSSESLLSNIDKVLTDPSYKRNAQLASDILRDRPDTAAQRVSAMIDHVLKYGDRHLRSGAFDLSPLQFMMFDVFAVLFAAAASTFLCFSCCCYLCIGHCCRSRRHCEKPKLH